MDKECAEELLACLSHERSCFHYFKDGYALQLLGYAAGSGSSIEALRRSRYARLLNKPLVKRVLAECGDGRICRQRLNAGWQSPLLPFLLTAGLWGSSRGGYGWQTSRPGYNLVLRLNFTQGHDRRFRELFAPYYRADSLNAYGGHPVMKSGERRYYRQTLAWARMDLDLLSGEALVEEIQTDWVREANEEGRRLPACAGCGRNPQNGYCHRVARARRYLDEVLKPYSDLWAEAMLSAALFFLREELGISKIWYHSWQYGNALKDIGSGSAPPRSLYERLPRQFCFSETSEVPGLLQGRAGDKRMRKTRLEPRFYHLEL